MTFDKYAAFFQPDELDALTAAYDAVWQHVWTTNAMNEAQASVIKNNLAQIILASACTGERDRERLKDIALRAVTGNRRIREPEPSPC
ncbi:MAG: hypothetical protein ACREC3_16645 [Methyloceanibacter sp.]